MLETCFPPILRTSFSFMRKKTLVFMLKIFQALLWNQLMRFKKF